LSTAGKVLASTSDALAACELHLLRENQKGNLQGFFPTPLFIAFELTWYLAVPTPDTGIPNKAMAILVNDIFERMRL